MEEGYREVRCKKCKRLIGRGQLSSFDFVCPRCGRRQMVSSDSKESESLPIAADAVNEIH
jgi:phage FluMu protein Com